MSLKRLTRHRNVVCILITGSVLSGCHNHKPNSVQESPPRYTSTTLPLDVKGVRFTLSAPWNNRLDLQQQQDQALTYTNEIDSEDRKVRQYLQVEKMPGGNSLYRLRSGIKAKSPDHNYDTYLEYTLNASCQHIQSRLDCEYFATEGLYQVDLPETSSLKASQTPKQMEENETVVLSKLNANPITVTDTLTTSLSLSQIKKKLQKKQFVVVSSSSGLLLERKKYNYTVELSDQKINRKSVINARYKINPWRNHVHQTDFVGPFNQAKKDLFAALQQ